MNNIILAEVAWNSIFTLAQFIKLIILWGDKPPTKTDIFDMALLLAQYIISSLIALHSIHIA